MNEIEEVPEPLLSEVLDFVHFLKAKEAPRQDQSPNMTQLLTTA